MKKCFIIGPESKKLLARLEGNSGGYTWITYDGCDIRNDTGLQQATEWIMEFRPEYVLIGLTDFDPSECENEKQFSRFLESHDIPAHFLLPERLRLHNIKAMEMSMETGVKDLWSCPLRGSEFLQHILAYIHASRQPVLANS